MRSPRHSFHSPSRNAVAAPPGCTSSRPATPGGGFRRRRCPLCPVRVHEIKLELVQATDPPPPGQILSGLGNSPSPLQTTFRDMLSRDRKSTRLNSSHLGISYAVFC